MSLGKSGNIRLSINLQGPIADAVEHVLGVDIADNLVEASNARPGRCP
jgi:hypothetical protein